MPHRALSHDDVGRHGGRDARRDLLLGHDGDRPLGRLQSADVLLRGDHGDLLRYTKNLIRSLPFGKVIMIRVLYDGQVFDGGKIHLPGEKEYEAFHAHVSYRR